MNQERMIHIPAGLLLAMLVLTPAMSLAAQIIVDTNASATIDTAINSATDAGATLSDSIIEVEAGAAGKTSSATETSGSDRQATNAAMSVSLMLNDNGVAITSAEAVESEDDLKVFAANAVAIRANLDKVTFDRDDEATAITVTYRHSGHFLGLMPVTIKSYTTTTIDAGGRIEVDSHIPWWGLMVTKIDHAESEIESRIAGNPTVLANAEADLSARSSAEITEAIIAELEAHAALQAELQKQ